MTRSRLVAKAFLVVSALFVACVVVQVFLAGLGVFESSLNFLTHRDFGYAFGWLALLMLILAIIGRLPRRQLLLVVAIVVAFALQSVLVAFRDDAPVVAALHPLNGVLILILGIEVTRYAWVTRNAGSPEATASAREAESRATPAEERPGSVS